MIDAPTAPPEAAPTREAEPPDEGTAARSRRALLALPILAGLGVACTSPGRGTPTPTTQLPAPGGPPSNVAPEVAVDKLTFGPRPGLVDAVRAMGVGAFIEAQLNPSGLPDAEARLAGYRSLANTNYQNYQLADSGEWDLIPAELDAATIIRAVHSERQLYELMCDFWSNHFNTWRSKTWMGFLKNADHRDVVRAHALGKFSDMLVASAHSPAMLDYLDNLPNDASTPGGVNQNYARELMELHTLGIVNGEQVHTEDDVAQVSKLISGWSIDWEVGPNKFGFRFAPWMHSLDAVSVLDGAYSRPARDYGEGYEDGLEFLDVLAHHPATARHICWKLCKRFISDDPPMSLVDSAAAVFSANDTAIVPTLRHIFNSPEFAAAEDSKIRRPFEHVVACLRALDATFGTDPEGKSIKSLRWVLDDLGQPIFERVSPDGYPDAGSFWISSAALLERWCFTGEVARNAFGHRSTPDKVVVNLAALLPAPLPATVAELIAWIGTHVANINIPAGDVADLCSAIGYSAGAAASTLTANESKLGLAFGLVLCHPLFQRR